VRPLPSRSAAAARLGDAGGHVPDEVIQWAKAAYERRSAGPVLAIVPDMVVEPGGERRLRFEHRLAHLEVGVNVAGAQRDLRGRVRSDQGMGVRRR
jgi:hypothetical protein